MQAIIFDYGGVLCFHPTDQQIDELAALCGLPRERFLEVYWGSRVEYDRGDFTPVEYWRKFAAAVGRDYTPEQISEFRRRDVQFWISLDQRMMQWVSALRSAGLKLGLISNLPFDLGEYLRSETTLFNLFDHVTLSYEQRCVKPDAPIYLECCAGLDIAPSGALFLDDREHNVRGAEAAGLNSLVFETPERLSRVLPSGLPPL